MRRRWLRPVLVALLLAPCVAAADPAPADLAAYKTPATAATTRVVKDANYTRGQPGHLGVGIDTATGKLVVSRVEPGSAAEAAGIKPGDVIRSLDRATPGGLDAFKQQLQAKVAGQSVEVGVERNGQVVTLAAKLRAPSNPMRDPGLPKPVLGVQLSPADNGVRVDGVTAGSPADQAGLREGDVLTGIDGAITRTLEALRERLAERVPGEEVTVQVIRDTRPMQVSIELAGPPGPAPDMPTLAGWNAQRMQVFRKPAYRLAVIPVQFPDVKINEKLSPDAWKEALFSTGTYKDESPTGQGVHGSLNDYYREISYGAFRVEGKVFDPITVGKNRTDYTQTASRTALLTEACDRLLERDGDGALKEYDGVFFIYAGRRVQTQRGGIYWPHRATFGHKGKRWAYFIVPEGAERMTSISVIAHEFGHMLGLPDLYARPEVPGSEGVGVWCTMSTGHGRDGKPLHFSAWCKETLGWLRPAVIDPRVPQKLVLAPVTDGPGECFKVLLRPDGSEYLLLENRVKKGFDRDLPGEGLLIWRVVANKPVLEESHGVGSPDGPRHYLGSVPYPSPSNRAFTPDTTPSSRPNLRGGWNVHITDIRRLQDGRVTFQIGYEYL
jgi:M6 family metalloprotease-like protein